MAENQIKSVSIRHDAIMDMLIAHPDRKLGDVAHACGVSQAWLSVIIHSDAFQIQLKAKQTDVFSQTVVPLREKLIGVAHLAVDKLGETLENSSSTNDKQYIADTADSILKNLGYSPKSAPPPLSSTVQQQNIFVVDKQALVAAREKMQIAANGGGTLIEHESACPPAEEV